jgi:hypothetical protein
LSELLADGGGHITEAVYLKPGIGNAINEGIGYSTSRKGLLAIIEQATEVAGNGHEELLLLWVVVNIGRYVSLLSFRDNFEL